MSFPDVKLENGLSLGNPMNNPNSIWIDDMKSWPTTDAPQVVAYLVESQACDLKQMKAYKSLESYNYLISGWVGKVLLTKVNDICFLKGEVTPSQRLKEEPHTAWVCLENSGAVITAGCTCMAGKGKACSHAGAILWKVEAANRLGLTGIACTDEAANWNKGTKRNIEPALIEDIQRKQPRLCQVTIETGSVLEVSENASNKLSKSHNTKQFFTHEDVLEHIKRSHLEELFHTPGTVFSTLKKSSHQLIVPNNQTEEIKELGPHDHSEPDDLPNSCQPCSEFYRQYIELCLSKRKLLNEMTVCQGSSSLWKESRRLRITASTAAKVPKKNSTNPEKFLVAHLYKPFRGNSDTRYGSSMEGKALNFYADIMSVVVQPSGTVVCATDCWLSASPDGLVGEDIILEIKCPNPHKFELSKADIIYVNGEHELNSQGQRGYFCQVQLTMHCTKRKLCHFFVYLGDGFLLVKCTYDKKYVERLLERLRKFYFLHFLPRLENDKRSNILNITDEYVNLCNNPINATV